MKKGYVLTLDALLALMVVMVIFTLIMSIQSSINTTEMTEFKRLHYISEDVLQSLSEKGVLDQISRQWALAEGNVTSPYYYLARNITNSYLSEMIPPTIGYELTINGMEVANDSTRRSLNDSGVETHSVRMLSGYNSSLPTDGYVARARINDTKVSYGSVFYSMDGCNWTIERQSDSVLVYLNFPKTYIGNVKCYYTNTTIAYDNRSAVNDAVHRLMVSMDTTPRNGRVEFDLRSDSVTTDVAILNTVRSISNPIKVELILWMD